MHVYSIVTCMLYTYEMPKDMYELPKEYVWADGDVNVYLDDT